MTLFEPTAGSPLDVPLPPKLAPHTVQRWSKDCLRRRLEQARIGERHVGRQACLLIRRKAERPAAACRSAAAIDERIEHQAQELIGQIERDMLGSRRILAVQPRQRFCEAIAPFVQTG